MIMDLLQTTHSSLTNLQMQMPAETVEENTASNNGEIHPLGSSANAQTQGIHPLSSSEYAQTQDSPSHETTLTITGVDNSLPSPEIHQERGSVSDYTAALKYFMLPLFSLVLVMKYQLKLREVSDKQWWLFFPAIFVYCCVFMVERRGKNFYNKYYEKLDFVAFSSVILSLASLISILIPKRFLYIPYVIWVFLALVWVRRIRGFVLIVIEFVRERSAASETLPDV